MIELAIPKLRTGNYFLLWLQEHRRAEQALISMVAAALPARSGSAREPR